MLTGFLPTKPFATSVGIKLIGIPRVLLTLSLASDIDSTLPPVNLDNPLPINPPSPGSTARLQFFVFLHRSSSVHDTNRFVTI